jgi:hypothetical protein
MDSKCPDCGNTFLQPFVCTSCGAQKLYDTTLTTAYATIDRLRAALTDLQRETRAHVQFSVRKHYSLMVADVEATKALEQSTKGEQS